jgi:DinB superfamily
VVLVNSISAVIDALARAPDVVIPLVREVPASVLKRRPTPTKWSAHEHACHLAAVHGLFLQRLDVFLAEPSPVITPYDPGTDDADDALLEEDLDRSLAAFVEDRVRLVTRLRGLSTDVWSKTAEHGEYSHYSVFIMFRHLALHDFFHAYRIEELLLRREWSAEWSAYAGRAAQQGHAADEAS